ncbi:hypothetical protein A2307_05080 [Candidatus Peregrinibacteria bacterium RIFOXYB2_FULL_33_20]|nr:MAG: hypothetical protein A2307_05080 [Candidatus Peregrinibacteria bacterium RIFOXYB2_FULL_33_20]
MSFKFNKIQVLALLCAFFGMVLFGYMIFEVFAYDENLKPVVKEFQVKLRQDIKQKGVYDIDLKVRDDNADDVKLSLALVLEDGRVTYPIFLDSHGVIVNLGATPDVNNFSPYQIGSTQPIQTSLGEISLSMTWSSLLTAFSNNLDANHAKLKAILFDNKNSSEEFFSNSFVINNLGKKQSTEEKFYALNKPIVDSVTTRSIQNGDTIPIDIVASGGMNNLLAKIEYFNSDIHDWEKCTISKVESTISSDSLEAIHLVSKSASQIAAIHTSAGPNHVTAYWDFKKDVGLYFDSDDVYVKVSLFNVLAKSEDKQYGPFVIDLKEPGSIENFVVTDNITSESVVLQWDTPYESHFKSGYYTVKVTETGFFKDITEYKFFQSSLAGNVYTVGGLKPNTEYIFEIDATDDYGNTRRSEQLSAKTNTLAEIYSRLILKKDDNNNKIQAEVMLRDLDSVVSVKKNKLRLKINYKYEDKIIKPEIDHEVLIEDQFNPVFVNNNNDYQVGDEGGYIRASDQFKSVILYLAPPQIPENINYIKVCVTVNDLMEDGNTVCEDMLARNPLENLPQIYNQIPKKKASEPVILNSVKSESIDRSDEDDLETSVNTAYDQYIESFLTAIGAKNFTIADFYFDQSKDFVFDNPEAKINRIDALRFVVMLNDIALKTADRDVFADVSREYPYSSFILTAVSKGIIDGFGASDIRLKKVFKPNDNITLSGALSMICKAAKLDIKVDDLDIKNWPFANIALSGDNKPWYADYFAWAYVNGLISEKDNSDEAVGVGKFVQMMMTAKNSVLINL